MKRAATLKHDPSKDRATPRRPTLAPLALAAALAAWSAAPAAAQEPPPATPRARTLEVLEYRVEGATRLSAVDLEGLLAPHLGPARTLEDVEAARAAIEKAYSSRGFHSVAVAIPPQTVRDGVVRLAVTEGRVGRLRVRGASWYSIGDIKRLAPSMEEGVVPNFEEIVRDIYRLNQLPDRRVTPALRAGAVPGTVDVDLNVEDRLPLHATLEVSNRHSANTARERLVGSLRYDNLFQRGHSLSLAFQLTPGRGSGAGNYWVFPQRMVSATYLARFPDSSWLSLSVNGVLMSNDVRLPGGVAVDGNSVMVGGRALFTLPSAAGSFHTLSTGLDLRRFEEGLTLGGDTLDTPLRYVPWTTEYSGSWAGEGGETRLGTSVVFNLRGLGSDADAFDAKRYEASGSFVVLRGEVSRTQELPRALQGSLRLQGQMASDPLVPSEQFAIGGLESVRGFLEAVASGDYGAAGQLELRSPSLARWLGKGVVTEWRFHAFADAGWNRIYAPLPEVQAERFLWSAGAGTRARLFERLSGALEVAVPFDHGARSPAFLFKVAGEI